MSQVPTLNLSIPVRHRHLLLSDDITNLTAVYFTTERGNRKQRDQQDRAKYTEFFVLVFYLNVAC
jgi:hypothetical protein